MQVGGNGRCEVIRESFTVFFSKCAALKLIQNYQEPLEFVNRLE